MTRAAFNNNKNTCSKASLSLRLCLGIKVIHGNLSLYDRPRSRILSVQFAIRLNFKN